MTTHQAALATCRAMLDGTTQPEQLIGPPTPRGLVRYGQDGSRHVAPGYVPPVFNPARFHFLLERVRHG